jgi:hypothetical protein
MYRKKLTRKKDWGFIKAEYFGNNNSLCEVANLLKKTVIEYATFNVDYCENFDKPDFPMAWGELQNQAIMFHSIYQALDSKSALFAEHPYDLTKYKYRGDNAEKRRLDYWGFMNNSVLLFEFKHMCVYIDKQYNDQSWNDKGQVNILHLQNVDTNGWKDDIDKLDKAVRYKKNRNLFSVPAGKTNSMAKIMLITIPILQLTVGNQKFDKKAFKYVAEEHFKEHLDEINKYINNTCGNTRYCPNWTAYWWLPEKRQADPIEWSENGITQREYYRGVYFFARLDSV